MIKTQLKTNSRLLFSELSKAGSLGSGTPYLRAQNTIAHCGIAGFLTLSLIHLNFDSVHAVVAILSIGVLWEVRGALQATTNLALVVRKAVLDVLAYFVGSCLVAVGDPAAALAFVFAAFALSYASALFGSAGGEG